MTAVQPALDLGLGEVAPAPGSRDDGRLVARPPGQDEPKGVIYTRKWVVELILDLVGYRSSEDLTRLRAVEPAAGDGAFLVSMVRRLLRSMRAHNRDLREAREAIRAYEVDAAAAARAVSVVAQELRDHGIGASEAEQLAAGWVIAGDYLVSSPQDGRADLVVGNPPYIRYDDLPSERLSIYRDLYPSMMGRCDIYVGFIEAGLRQLKNGGVLGFICADRWMRSAYGAQLRRMISAGFAVQTVIEMHDAPAFENDVAAYAAVTVIRRGPQGKVLVANAGPAAGSPSAAGLADAVTGLAEGRVAAVPGFRAATAQHWFHGPASWPSAEPAVLQVLQQLEDNFAPLEDELTGTKIGIGVATGADRVFLTTDPTAVEPDRLLPLAMTADTRQGVLQWSGHYLIDPWGRNGHLVDLAGYPRLRAYLERRKNEIRGRNIAQRHPENWYRTIDRVQHALTAQPKLYFPDMKLVSNPVLDRGETYPHHNLYYLTSQVWDLEVLGGLLLSRVAQLFVEAYCVKMRGGTLRFQAQYLRRIRVPDPSSIPGHLRDRLRQAFRARDAVAATSAAAEAYGLPGLAEVLGVNGS